MDIKSGWVYVYKYMSIGNYTEDFLKGVEREYNSTNYNFTKGSDYRLF